MSNIVACTQYQKSANTAFPYERSRDRCEITASIKTGSQ